MWKKPDGYGQKYRDSRGMVRGRDLPNSDRVTSDAGVPSTCLVMDVLCELALENAIEMRGGYQHLSQLQYST